MNCCSLKSKALQFRELIECHRNNVVVGIESWFLADISSEEYLQSSGGLGMTGTLGRPPPLPFSPPLFQRILMCIGKTNLVILEMVCLLPYLNLCPLPEN